MSSKLMENDNRNLLSSAENFRFLGNFGNISHAVKRGAISEALSGTFDSIKEYSSEDPLDKSETSPNALSVVTLGLDNQISSTISSVNGNIERTIEFEDGEPFQMSYGADVGWTIVFGLMIGNAIIGNLVVFWIVLGN